MHELFPRHVLVKEMILVKITTALFKSHASRALRTHVILKILTRARDFKLVTATCSFPRLAPLASVTKSQITIHPRAGREPSERLYKVGTKFLCVL